MRPALLEAWRAGLFRRAHWLPNLAAGVVVGVVAIPLAMVGWVNPIVAAMALVVTVALGLLLVAVLQGWIRVAEHTRWVDAHAAWGIPPSGGMRALPDFLYGKQNQ